MGGLLRSRWLPGAAKRQEEPREGMEKERRLDLAFTISLPNRQHWAASIF
jgi:hypothetical protein